MEICGIWPLVGTGGPVGDCQEIKGFGIIINQFIQQLCPFVGAT
jgi:hypothetical protein